MPFSRRRSVRVVTRVVDQDDVSTLLLQWADGLQAATKPGDTLDTVKVGRIPKRTSLLELQNGLLRHFTHNVPHYLQEMTGGAVLRSELSDDPLLLSSALAPAALAAEAYLALCRRDSDVAHGISDAALLSDPRHANGRHEQVHDMFRLRTYLFEAISAQLEGRAAFPGDDARAIVQHRDAEPVVIEVEPAGWPKVDLAGMLRRRDAEVAAPYALRTPGSRLARNSDMLVDVVAYDPSSDTSTLEVRFSTRSDAVAQQVDTPAASWSNQLAYPYITDVKVPMEGFRVPRIAGPTVRPPDAGAQGPSL
jgi:hypothetical protein